ncbi:MAG TPA: glycosyl hydrolase family 65 protein [Nocardioidaceae bacterium]|nr:glycosyl hydrolase family 65 protein [Nocardioidaceae bacterium]
MTAATSTDAGPAAPRVDDPLDRHRFPAHPWKLSETRVDSHLGRNETLFAVGNGYLGLRGNVEEGRESFAHGTYVNGFHETFTIQHAEEAFGFARVGQTMVNVPDSKVIRLYVDDEPLLLSTADLDDYDRTLDFRAGMLTRSLVWRTPAGKRVRVRSTRMVSMTDRHLAVMTFEVTLLDSDAPVAISSQLLNRQDGEDEYHVRSAAMGEGADPRKTATFQRRVLVPQSIGAEADTERIIQGFRCAESGMTIAVAVDHAFETENATASNHHVDPDVARMTYRIDARVGVPIRLVKTAAYHTSHGVPVRELVSRCRRTLDRAAYLGLDRLETDQRQWFDGYWERSDVEVDGPPEVQQAVRWNLFQLAQAAGRAEGFGVPAKGVTGSGYSGHYFWDTEVYTLPFFTYTTPHCSRSALRFRYSLLSAARTRAEQMTQRGALFPWRTINGEEASAYYAAGTAQYHIDADIAYALSQYVAATGDQDFLRREAVDILVETARMWADLGFWRVNGDGVFHIHGVTGPDEYTTVVNDNLFTNVMARGNLRDAAETVGWLAENDPEGYARMAARLRLSEDEPEEWRRAADRMFVPFDTHLGIHPQDAHFLEREVWDLEQTPASSRPLLLHYHPLVIYRFQVIKQADVVLALFLHGESFTDEEKRANFEYYDPITTGDSTLSAVVQSIIAAEVGYHQLALRYFYSSLFVDLADLHANASDGVHVASTGGVWSALVYGFGGLRDGGGRYAIDPRLPEAWRSLTYRLTLRGARLRVCVDREAVTLTLETGEEATVTVRGKQVQVTADAPVVGPLDGMGPRLSGTPPPWGRDGVRRADGSVITASVPRGTGPAR